MDMGVIDDKHPFKLQGALKLTSFQRLNQALEHVIERFSGLSRLDKLYAQLPPDSSKDPETFITRVLKLFSLSYEIKSGGLEGIPDKGPTLIVANHPFGTIEGMMLIHLLKQMRPDVCVMANHLLTRIPALRELIIPVNPFGSHRAKHENMICMRKAIRYLKNGGLLIMFPAGEVSSLRLNNFQIKDPAWTPMLSRLVRITQAPVLPVYFSGRNSALFQLLGLIHPVIRTAMIPRELLNKQRRNFEISIGKIINYHKIKDKTDLEIRDYLRLRTYMLKDMVNTNRPRNNYKAIPNKVDPIIGPCSPTLLKAEIETLPPEQYLAGNGPLRVYYAKTEQIPWILREIGRLREHTFRHTGEGTGKSIDIDLYDQYYQHLFVWNDDKSEIVGAYRMGLVDEIIAKYGLKGLYTHSLFRYDHTLVNKISPCIEMGRSFVRAEYQKNFSPLLLLWKGIGNYIYMHPHYRYLFGPVSISNDYETVSRQLLVDFLEQYKSDTDLSRLVRPRTPYRRIKRHSWQSKDVVVFNDLDHLSELLAQFEQDEKGVPVLLKQYIKLGGTLLGFNVDHQFNETLDGLVMVDLVNTDRRILNKYMGKEALMAFIAYHKSRERMAS